ncbi:CRISPR-associated endoribonuclease Cas6 [Leptolyngbya sp. FACHB-17]|uniref:CRISPR-associated endoribonuclease Cas6 n=1 Tax=unclassified Leptolyngbya TaxID=2650499 RepID=UPI001680DD5C|nr:CRISPR-associated endoribonuclease Cas6 [Leptolyngbya sp. FACHB-17]MBD2083351.1 CRISPR-associated endoribonuclease Cas6 [Leptolyngbya sp. FACHB-17]
MPYSLVLNLLPRSPISQAHLGGRHLHALFLDLVHSIDPELATVLHHQESEKAFTLSPLQVEYSRRGNQKTHLLQWQHDRSIPAGTPCWWRISLLDDALFGKLMHLWLSLSPSKAWRLGASDLQVVSVLGTSQVNQPWAGFSTYAQLFEQASDADRQIHLQFYTPTTFRQTKYDCALPTKEFVFNSLLRRWNHYSGLPFAETILEPIYPSFFDIRTEIAIDSRSKLIGCVGNVTFQILGNVEATMIQQINALADFALFSGVGRKTPMGMGMARRLVQRSSR